MTSSVDSKNDTVNAHRGAGRGRSSGGGRGGTSPQKVPHTESYAQNKERRDSVSVGEKEDAETDNEAVISYVVLKWAPKRTQRSGGARYPNQGSGSV